MSGAQIGTVVGGAIGAYFGGPYGMQLGMAIGGAIGGAVDPQHIYGPKIGDGQQQTATDGAVIAWVQGTAMIAGTIVQVSPRRQTRHKTGGKGGGPVQVTYTAVQDFAILVCESSELRGSTIDSILMVLQDGKIVYDVRPGSTILEASAKWKANVDFLFGDEAQMPHPTLEAITGVGNTPAYRGSCVAVFKNFDVSAAGERIPSFQFVVSTSATTTPLLRWTRSYQKSADPTFNVALPSVNEGDLMVLFVGYAVQFGTTPVTLPAGWTIQYRSTAANYGDWVCITKVAGANEPTGLVFTGAPFSSKYGAWTCNAYCVQSGSYAPGTLASAYNPISGAVPPQTLSGGAGALFIANAYDTRYPPPVTWPASSPSDRLETDQAFLSYYGTPLTAIMASVVQTSATVSSAWSGAFAPLSDGVGVVGIAARASAAAGVPPTLASATAAICARGGLATTDVDTSALVGIPLIGYPIARQANAADCLLPLLQAYFAFGSEYEAKLAFQFYGQNAAVTVNTADLLEGNDANSGAIKKNLRNQATEFPRRIVGKYMDPSQNYMVVTTAAERRSVDVIAIGDQSFDIPVVMTADDAAKAVDKALKVAYATLEGKLEYSVPFADSDVYLKLAAGEALILNGKRWVADEVIVSTGYLKLTTRYDRQSAYTSTIQAIAGNAPTPPESLYSGRTTLVVLDVQAQRPQDSIGVYIAAAGADGQDGWRGCTVQVSYDGQANWQTALTIISESTIGSVSAAEPTSGEPLTVTTLKYPLSSVAASQRAAGDNVFAITSGGVAQIGQFNTATEVGSSLEYTLTDVLRSVGGTTSAPVAAGDAFTLMDAAYFLAIDPLFKGRTIYFRGVGFGEIPEDSTIYSVVYGAYQALVTTMRVNAFDYLTTTCGDTSTTWAQSLPGGTVTVEVRVGGALKHTQTLAAQPYVYTAAQRAADGTDGTQKVAIRLVPVDPNRAGGTPERIFTMTGLGMILGEYLGGTQG